MSIIYFLNQIQKKQDEKDLQYIEKNSQIFSEHMQEYEHFFYSESRKKKGDFTEEQILNELGESQNIQINYNFNKKPHLSYFSVVQIKPTNSPQIFQLFVNYQIFSAKLTLLIVPKQFTVTTQDIFDEGNNGTILLSYNQQNSTVFVIKCFKIKFKDQLTPILLDVLKQYMLALIMSEFQIGPKIIKDFGFDILIYSNCIQFSMQLCQKVKYKQNSEASLKQNLLKMHSLNIVHLDIKPENIAYSNFHKKQVFIDFGHTQMTICKLGNKLFLKGFIGTYSYSSPQMKECLYNPNYVDLYYNDVYSLNQTLDYFKSSQKFNQLYPNEFSEREMFLSQQDQSNIALQDDFVQIKIKFYFYMENMIKGKNTLNQIKNIINFQQIVRFLCNCQPTQFLKDFYQNTISKKMGINQKKRRQFDRKLKRFLKFQFNLNCEQETTSFDSKDNEKKRHIQFIKNTIFSVYSSNSEIQNIQNNNTDKIYLKNQDQNFKQAKINIKILFQETLSINTQEQKQKYLQMVFKFVTFQQNHYKATFEQKQIVLVKFFQIFHINQSSFLGYALSKPKILKFAVFIKYLLDFCQSLPYTKIKASLFPKICRQFALINPDIFTTRHSFNYFEKWYQFVYQQNKQNLYQMSVQLLCIRQISKLLLHRNDQYFYQNFYDGELQKRLSFFKPDPKYLLQKLGDQIIVKQYLKMMNFQKQKQQKSIQKNDVYFLELEVSIINSNISKESKKCLLSQIQIYKVFHVSDKNTFDKNYREAVLSKMHQNQLSVQKFIFCALYKSRFQFYNCRECLKSIDSIINCPQISQNYFGCIRIYIQLYLGSLSDSIKKYETVATNLNYNQCVESTFIVELIQLQNIMKKEVQNIKYTNYQLDINVQRIVNITKNILIPKIDKFIKIQINCLQSDNYREKFQLYRELFRVLRQSIRSIATSVKAKISIQSYYQIFQALYPKFIEILKPNQFYYKDVKEFKTFEYCIKKISQQKYEQLADDLFLNLKTIDLKDNKQLQQNLIQVLYFIKTYFQIWRRNCYKIFDKFQASQVTIFYQQTLAILYEYLIKHQKFVTCLSFGAPTGQIFLYFCQKNQYRKLFQYILSVVSFINKNPNSIYISTFMKSIQYIRIVYLNQKTHKLDQILNEFFKFQYEQNDAKNQQLKHQNAYWYTIANQVLSWSQVFAYEYRIRTLAKIANSIKFLIFKAKETLYENFYTNYQFVIDSYYWQTKYIKRIRIQNHASNNNNLKQHHIQQNNCTQEWLQRKRRYIWKKHYKAWTNEWYSMKFIFPLKLGLQVIKLKKVYPLFYGHIYKKLQKYHQNLGHLKNELCSKKQTI